MPKTDTEHRVRVGSAAQQPLTAEDEAVYRRLAAREHARPEDEPHLERLRAHHLIEHDPHSPHTPLTLDPRTAERRTIEEVHAGITSELARLRQLTASFERLESVFTEQQPSSGGVRLLSTPELANASIGRSMARLTTAVYTAQPVQRSPEILAASRERDGNLLQRGVRLYTIYPQSARSREPESQWAEYMAGQGAEIRTCPLPFPRMILVDTIAAYVEEPLAQDEESGTPVVGAAIEITHPSLVMWVRSLYMGWWRMSQPWRGERAFNGPPSTGTLTTPRERAILRFLENEVTRPRIARDLDVTQRTISTELTSLRRKFQVDTDFALALRWRDHPEYNLP